MARTCMVLVVMTTLSLLGCGSDGDGDWGSNLIFSDKEEYINGNWRVFRLPTGPLYDMKLEYLIEGAPNTLEETAQQCMHGTGIKHDIDAGFLFTTKLTFE